MIEAFSMRLGMAPISENRRSGVGRPRTRSFAHEESLCPAELRSTNLSSQDSARRHGADPELSFQLPIRFHDLFRGEAPYSIAL